MNAGGIRHLLRRFKFVVRGFAKKRPQGIREQVREVFWRAERPLEFRCGNAPKSAGCRGEFTPVAQRSKDLAHDG